MVGTTVTVGWSPYIAGEAAVVPTKVLMLGASGSSIYNTGVAGTSLSVIDIVK